MSSLISRVLCVDLSLETSVVVFRIFCGEGSSAEFVLANISETRFLRNVV